MELGTGIEPMSADYHSAILPVELTQLKRLFGDQGRNRTCKTYLKVSHKTFVLSWSMEQKVGLITYILTFTCQSSMPNVNNSFSEFLESYY